MAYKDCPIWASTGTPDAGLFNEQLKERLAAMEADIYSYSLDLKGKRFEPEALDAELRRAIGDATYRGLSTYGLHKPVTVFIFGAPTDELAAIIEAVGAKHLSEPEPEAQPVKPRRKKGTQNGTPTDG